MALLAYRGMPPKLSCDLGVAEKNLIADRLRMAVHNKTLALNKLLHDISTFVVHGHSQDHEPLWAILLAANSMNQGISTQHGWHQGGPEIHEDYFSL